MGTIPNPRRTRGLVGLIPLIVPPLSSVSAYYSGFIPLAMDQHYLGSQQNGRGELLLLNLDGMEEEVAVVLVFLVSVVEEGDFQFLFPAG